MNTWLVIGSVQNWETALAQPVPIWGLRPAHNAAFDAMQPGDTVWFYATSPVGRKKTVSGTILNLPGPANSSFVGGCGLLLCHERTSS